jgi:hypothetical protein
MEKGIEPDETDGRNSASAGRFSSGVAASRSNTILPVEPKSIWATFEPPYEKKAGSHS